MEKNDQKKESGIKFPGFEFNYPTTIYGVGTILIVSLTIVLALLVIFVWANNIPELTALLPQKNTYRSDADGNIKDLGESVQFQFMTPSPESYNYHKQICNYSKMTSEEKSKFEERFEWEKDVDSLDINEFGKLILKKISNGYRYYNYHGEGSSQEDIGLWWVVTADPNISLRKFVTLYKDFWSPPKGIYIEEIRTSADIRLKE